MLRYDATSQLVLDGFSLVKIVTVRDLITGEISVSRELITELPMIATL